MYSYEIVKRILETAIDSLVDNFAREPYIHRCEHSIHCELYNMLVVHRALDGLYLLNNEGRRTTLIHKEWPETKPRPEKKGRRGNFDLAILDPAEILSSTVKEFTEGRITPAFVVEMGLNYPLDHLRDDDDKLENSGFNKKNSGCNKHGYLIHLWQPHKGITKKDVEKLLNWMPEAKNMVASVMFFDGEVMVKHLSDTNLVNISKNEYC